MTDDEIREQLDNFTDEDGDLGWNDQIRAVRSILQAARATPADHSSLTTEEIQLAVKVWRERRTRMPDIAVQEAFTDGLAAASALFKRRATPADAVLKNPTNNYLFKRMADYFDIALGKDTVSEALDKVENHATPADHIGDAAEKVDAGSVPVAWLHDAIEYIKAGIESEGPLEAEHSIEARRLISTAPQPPQNAADHIEAQSVRDAWISVDERLPE